MHPWEKVLRLADQWRDETIPLGQGRSNRTAQTNCKWIVNACSQLREAIDAWREAGRPIPETRCPICERKGAHAASCPDRIEPGG